MFGEEKKLKDSPVMDLGITVKDSHFPVSYNKTNKLITALYMVTDILDKDEPLRNKLRTRGAEIISDMNFCPANACIKIADIMSFLDIASAVNIISEMNCNILRKEFSELDRAIRESAEKIENTDQQINLLNFFDEPSTVDTQATLKDSRQFSGQVSGQIHSSSSRQNNKGEQAHTRIGVQKGGTLMGVLNKIGMHDKRVIKTDKSNTESFNDLKKQRREEIKDIIRKIGEATITDIKNKIQGSLASCGEKTLQRELISMLKDGILDKIGEKRWSKYFLKNKN